MYVFVYYIHVCMILCASLEKKNYVCRISLYNIHLHHADISIYVSVYMYVCVPVYICVYVRSCILYIYFGHRLLSLKFIFELV